MKNPRSSLLEHSEVTCHEPISLEKDNISQKEAVCNKLIKTFDDLRFLITEARNLGLDVKIQQPSAWNLDMEITETLIRI